MSARPGEPDTQTAEEREAKALALAYEKGRKDERVKSRLDNSERRLDGINGSIASLAAGQEDLAGELRGTNSKLDEILAARKIDAEVSTALTEASAKLALKSETLAANTVTQRQMFWLAVGGSVGITMLVISGVTLLHVFHVI